MAMALGIVSFPVNSISRADTEHVQDEAEGTQNSSLTEGKGEAFLATFKSFTEHLPKPRKGRLGASF